MPVDMKEKIADQLNALLRRKSLDKITVKELVDGCGISRQTFYYHFQDIMDVVEWQQKRVLAQGIARSLAAPDPQSAIRSLVREGLENQDWVDRLMASRRRAEIERLLVRTMSDYLAQMMLRRAPDRMLSAADADAVLCFYASGVVGLMLDGLHRRDTDPDALADRIYRLLSAQLTLG